MRGNIIQGGPTGKDGRLHIAHDWYSRGLPSNVHLAPNVFVDTSYSFAGFHSMQPNALTLDEGTGCYDRSSIITSIQGIIRVGKFTILNGTTLLCQKSIVIGSHCMLAWGSVVTDSWLTGKHSIEERRRLLKRAAADPLRSHPFPKEAQEVIIEDNCWVGFDAVILPGVRLGRGSVVGCKTVVDFDVPPYAVVAGSPARIIRYLEPNDTSTARKEALSKFPKT